MTRPLNDEDATLRPGNPQRERIHCQDSPAGNFAQPGMARAIHNWARSAAGRRLRANVRILLFFSNWAAPGFQKNAARTAPIRLGTQGAMAPAAVQR